MNIIIRAYQNTDLPAMNQIWNEVVEDGVAFPQEAHEEHLMRYRNQTHGEGYLRQFFNTKIGRASCRERV